jgi:hypothetical protein
MDFSMHRVQVRRHARKQQGMGSEGVSAQEITFQRREEGPGDGVVIAVAHCAHPDQYGMSV